MLCCYSSSLELPEDDLNQPDFTSFSKLFRVHQTIYGPTVSVIVSLCLSLSLSVFVLHTAVSGAASAIIFNKNMNVFTSSFMDIKLASYGWAFYMFCAGVGILGVVSFMACFSAPENPIRGMVYSQPAAPTTVVTTQNQQQLFCGDSPQPLQCQVNALSPV